VRRAAALALLLGGCGSPQPTAAPTSAAVPTSVPQAGRAIGTTSALTGQTSALTGAISDFQVERTATETRVALAADTLFAFDEATLTPAAESNLTRTAELVEAGGEGTVRVTGFTDAKGEEAYNLDLSRRRAEAVVAWLRARPKLAARSFEAVGLGEAEPVAPNAGPNGVDDPQGRARNRRVVVAIPR